MRVHLVKVVGPNDPDNGIAQGREILIHVFQRPSADSVPFIDM